MITQMTIFDQPVPDQTLGDKEKVIAHFRKMSPERRLTERVKYEKLIEENQAGSLTRYSFNSQLKRKEPVPKMIWMVQHWVEGLRLLNLVIDGKETRL